MAATLAVAAVVMPWAIGPRANVAPLVAAGSPSAGDASGSAPAPTAAPVRLARAEKWFLSFDYPESWTLVDRDLPPWGSPLPLARKQDSAGGDFINASLGFLGTGTADETCAAPGPDRGVICKTTWTLPQSGVEIRFWINDNSSTWSGERAVQGVTHSGFQPITVAGLPSLFASSTSGLVPNPDRTATPERIEGADKILWWELSSQLGFEQSYAITAAIRGPNTAELESMVRALVDSIHWVPEPYVLPTGKDLVARETAAIPEALSELRRNLLYGSEARHGAYDCFPATAGGSAQASIVHTPQAVPLTQPLPVTCTTDITTNVMNGFTLTLTQTWKAGADYPAGRQIFVSYLDLTGYVIGEDSTAWLPTYPHMGTPGTPG